MHGMHARLPKHFVLEERLERYRDVIEPDPYHWRGHWASACAPAGATPFREVRLDLGCGKGSFTVEAARREPDVLFVGMDSEPVCIAYAAQRAVESGLPNVVFVPGTGMRIREMFAEGELGRIYLNFPTPFPRKRESHLRLVNLERLMDYRRCASLLSPSGSSPAIARPGAQTMPARSAPSSPPASTSCASARREPRSSPSLARPGSPRQKIRGRLPR